MEQLGKVHEWNDERGFGFILPLDSQQGIGKTFFHIRDYQQAGRRPQPGELVKYRASQDAGGKWRASQVRRAVTGKPAMTRRENSNDRPSRALAWLEWLPVFGYLLFFGWLTWITHRLPIESWFVLLLLWPMTFIAYALDKDAAQRQRWRIKESVLHLLELLGGWPAALFAQRTLRHKSRKTGYRVVFWLMALLHCAVLVLWAFKWP